MEETFVCPKCKSLLQTHLNFCPTCGESLHAKELSNTLTQQIIMYLGSILLAPFGLIWAIKYLRTTNKTSKRIGIIIIVLTILSFSFTIWIFLEVVKSYSSLIQTYNF